jgi:DNA-damage-inducible protein J
MADARLSIRVDKGIKDKAERVFRELGLSTSTGINIYLNAVAKREEIPFPLSLKKTRADTVSDKELFAASDKLMEENRKVYEVLAQ